MKNDLSHPYKRFLAYDNLLNTDTNFSSINQDEDYVYGISMATIAQKINLPIEVVRNDFLFLQKSISYTEFISTEESELSEQFPSFLSEDIINHWDSCALSKNKKNDLSAFEDIEQEFEQAVKSGHFDQVLLKHLKTASFIKVSPQTIRFPLTKDEYHALLLLNEKETFTNQSEHNPFFYDYLVKDSYRYLLNQKNLLTYLLEVHSAIDNDSCLELIYKKNKNKHTIRPYKIIYDAFENQYAILATDTSVYRLDRILSIKQSKEQLEESRIINPDIFPTVWGFAFSAPPLKIVIRFYPDQKVRIWDKVRSDLSCRTNGKLYEKDGFLYYEDEVRGIDSFLKWFYSYGASAELMEPYNLRERVIHSYQERLRRHQS